MILQNDYFDSEEFRELLDIYEESLTSGVLPYLDVDDFSDVADYYMNVDKPDAAINCIERGLNIYPDEQQLWLIKSGAFIYLHRFEEARDIVERYDETNNEVLYQKAQLQYALYKDVSKAEEMFSEWVAGEREYARIEEEDERQREEYVRDSYIHVITSFIELTEEGGNDTEELVKRWVELYLANFSPLGNYDSDLVLADTVRCECLYDMVVKVYSSILETNPYLNHGWTVLAAAQFTCNMLDDALDSVEFALAVDPNDMDSVLTKAHCLISKGCYAEAPELLERYMSATNDHSQNLALATCYRECDDTEGALRCLEKAEQFYAKYVSDGEYYSTACFEMAELYFSLNRIEKARTYIDKAIEYNSVEPEYQLLSATLMLCEDRLSDALPLFAKYIEGESDIVSAVVRIVSRLIVFNYDTVALGLLNMVEKHSRAKVEGIEKIYLYKALIFIRGGEHKKAAECLRHCIGKCNDMIRWVLTDYIPEGMSLEKFLAFLENS